MGGALADRNSGRLRGTNSTGGAVRRLVRARPVRTVARRTPDELPFAATRWRLAVGLFVAVGGGRVTARGAARSERARLSTTLGASGRFLWRLSGAVCAGLVSRAVSRLSAVGIERRRRARGIAACCCSRGRH